MVQKSPNACFSADILAEAKLSADGSRFELTFAKGFKKERVSLPVRFSKELLLPIIASALPDFAPAIQGWECALNVSFWETGSSDLEPLVLLKVHGIPFGFNVDDAEQLWRDIRQAAEIAKADHGTGNKRQ
jgi:hypothetical protein